MASIENMQVEKGADDIINTDNDCQCHSVPCNIDFDGRAPVEVYFLPQLVSGDGVTEETKQDNKNTTDESKQKKKIYAAHLRGRQLLASDPYQHPKSNKNSDDMIIPMQGRLLEIDAHKAKKSNEKVQVIGKFSSIYEWKHECEPAVLENASMEKNRVLAAFQWCDVAHALHDPIPI